MKELLRKALCAHLSAALVLMGTGCAGQKTQTDAEPGPLVVSQEPAHEANTESEHNTAALSVAELPDIQTEGIQFSSLSDPELQRYIEDAVYTELVSDLDSEDYFVESVDAIYVSSEYLEELAYNSRANIFFGYTLEELEGLFQGEKYVFTLGEDGHTVVRAFAGYDDVFTQVVRDVAIGGGVILLCVTVSAVTGAVGMPAVSMIFALSAKTGTIAALSSGAIGGVSAAVFTGIQTGDAEQALEDGMVAAAEGFKWGAIVGALSGGIDEAAGLYRASVYSAEAYGGTELTGLTMNQVAAIQRESRLPLDVIRQIGSWEQYEILRDAGVFKKMVNGHTALVRNIDLTFMDEYGRTNLERMREGLAALDPATGLPYELHHVGQRPDSTLAILTREEHRLGESYSINHPFGSSDVHANPNDWNAQKEAFWKSLAEQLTQ